MWRLRVYAAAVLAVLVSPCQADTFTDAAGQLPTCGLSCILDAIPSSICGSVLNETCICADDDLTNVVQACVTRNCTVLEQLDIARLQAEACRRPVRSKRQVTRFSLIVEIPAYVCLVLRLYSRYWTVKHFEVDDYIMIFVGVLGVIFTVIGHVAAESAFGVDTWTVPPDTLTYALKLFYVDESLYLAILMLTKVSILFFYLRIFPVRRMRLAIFAVMGWVVICNVALIFGQIFQCSPISYIWDGWMGTASGPHRCVDVNALTYSAAALSIAQDAALIALPLPTVLALHAPWRARAGIVLMFSLGVFVLITSCVRLRFLVLFARSLNPSWDYTDTLVWTGVEVSVSIIVASLPAIRVLVNRVWPDLFGILTGFRTRRHGASYGNACTSGALEGPTALASRSAASRYTEARARNYSQKSGGGSMGSSGCRGIGGRSAQSRMFSIMAGPPDGEGPGGDNESQLELGDRKHGLVQTEIGTGYSDDEEEMEIGNEDSGRSRAASRSAAGSLGRGLDVPGECGRSDSSSSEEGGRGGPSPLPRIHVRTTTTTTIAEGRGRKT